MRRKHKSTPDRKKDLAFHLILLAWPVLQFCVFYLFVNFNSILLAFNYGADANPNGGFFYYFAQCFQQEGGSYIYLESMGIAVILYLCSAVLSIPLSLLFAYYISRRFVGSKFYRFVLFLPSILSATVMIILFKYFNDLEILYFAHEHLPVDKVVNILATDRKTTYITIILFDAFINFGTTTLIYSNKMSEIPTDIYEAAQLDGVSHIREFFSISLPLTFPTLSTFIVTGIATMFVNQYSLFTFFGSNLNNLAPGPAGYVIYNNIQQYAVQGNYQAEAFHQMAAFGLICTFITIPLVFGVKYLLERFGPRED